MRITREWVLKALLAIGVMLLIAVLAAVYAYKVHFGGMERTIKTARGDLKEPSGPPIGFFSFIFIFLAMILLFNIIPIGFLITFIVAIIINIAFSGKTKTSQAN